MEQVGEPQVAASDHEQRALAREAIEFLASFERGSASPGERRAAHWIAERLAEEGCSASVDEERAHGTYWWPLGLASATAGIAALRGGRLVRSIAGALCAAAIADDVSAGGLWLRRLLLPRRTTWNVVAGIGDEHAPRTVVLVAHHDAAHWSLLFAPQVPEFFGERFPQALERSDTTPPVMAPVFGGPLLVALSGLTGSRVLRRAGAALSLATAATMVEIGSRSVVAGANDNLSGVAVLLGVAHRLRERPLDDVRVVLVSTGAEESFMEGMHGFARRHLDAMSIDSTHVICIDSVGSERLTQLEGEGMLRMRDYPEDFKALVSECARDEGIELGRGLRFRNATDGLLALKRGFPAVMLGSINRYKAPANYHWPTDVPDNLDYDSIADATRLCDAVVRRLAARS